MEGCSYHRDVKHKNKQNRISLPKHNRSYSSLLFPSVIIHPHHYLAPSTFSSSTSSALLNLCVKSVTVKVISFSERFLTLLVLICHVFLLTHNMLSPPQLCLCSGITNSTFTKSTGFHKHGKSWSDLRNI